MSSMMLSLESVDEGILETMQSLWKMSIEMAKYLRCMGTPSYFSSIFSNRNHFCDLLLDWCQSIK